VIRKEHMQLHRRFRKSELIEKFIFAADAPIEVGAIFHYGNSHWKTTEVVPAEDEVFVRAGSCTREGEPLLVRSDYWLPLTPQVCAFLTAMTAPDALPPQVTRQSTAGTGYELRSIILFGELYGSGVQDMHYGLANGEKRFIVFGLAVNGQIVDYDTQTKLLSAHNIPAAPLLYRGPFRAGLVESLTDGPTTLAPPEKIAGKFKGREGVVITPATERFSDLILKRCCYKSISADYLARDGGTDFH
jgi:hypothetical protein